MDDAAESFGIDYNGKIYKCQDTRAIRIKLENDPEFFEKYMAKRLEKEKEAALRDIQDLSSDFAWTRRTIYLLINCYKERKELFRDPRCKKRKLWTEIKHEFHSKGITVMTEDMLDRKFRNLKKTFKTIQEKIIATGVKKVTWEFYDDFYDIFGEDDNITFEETSFATLSKHNYSMGANNTVAMKSPPLSPTSFSSLSSEDLSLGPLNENVSNDALASKTPKRVKENGSSSHEYKKKKLEIQEKHLWEYKKIRKAIEKGNELQEERNKILMMLLENRSNNS